MRSARIGPLLPRERLRAAHRPVRTSVSGDASDLPTSRLDRIAAASSSTVLHRRARHGREIGPPSSTRRTPMLLVHHVCLGLRLDRRRPTAGERRKRLRRGRSALRATELSTSRAASPGRSTARSLDSNASVGGGVACRPPIIPAAPGAARYAASDWPRAVAGRHAMSATGIRTGAWGRRRGEDDDHGSEW